MNTRLSLYRNQVSRVRANDERAIQEAKAHIKTINAAMRKGRESRAVAREDVESPSDAADLVSALVNFLDELPGTDVAADDPRVIAQIEKTLSLLKAGSGADDKDDAADSSLDNTESAASLLTESERRLPHGPPGQYVFDYDALRTPMARAIGVAAEMAKAASSGYYLGSFEPHRTKEVSLTEGRSVASTAYNFDFSDDR